MVAEDCGFGNKDESIRDQFVTGIANEDLAEKIEMLYFSKKGDLTLADVVEYTRTYNDVHEGRKLEREQSKMVEEVKAKAKAGQPKLEEKCKFCLKVHKPQKWGGGVEEARFGSYGEIDEAFLGECFISESPGRGTEERLWRVPIGIRQKRVVFNVDSGADVTLINYRTFQDLGGKNNLSLVCPNKGLNNPGGRIPVKGKVKLTLQYKDKAVSEEIFVVDEGKNTENLLSRQASVDLGLIQFVGEVNIPDNLFGFDEWNTEEVELQLKGEWSRIG